MNRPETRYAKSGDVHIAYQVHGAGPLDLVFVPGFVSNIDLQWDDPGFRRFFSRLEAFARVIRFDKRGTGLSDHLVQIATLEQRMDDLRAVMDAAGSESAVILGASDGGSLSLLFAATYPARVRALALYAGFAHYSGDVTSGEKLQRYLADVEAGWGRGISLRWFAPELAGDPSAAARWARMEQLGASPRALRQIVQMNIGIDVRDVLPSIRAPTLLLHRRGDPRVSVIAGRFLAERISGARLVELPGDVHPLFLGDVDAIVDEVEAFVTGVRPAPLAFETRLASILAIQLAGGAQAALAAGGDEAWAAALSRFSGAATGAAERHQGRLLGTPLGADGSGLALFDGPARAVRCAVALREAAQHELGTGLCAGIHVGEVAAEGRGEGLGGLAIHVARNVARLARPGEVLVTNTVRDLVPGAGLRFRERELRLPAAEAGGVQLTLLALAGDDRSRPLAAIPAQPAPAGLSELSARERDVLCQLARGMSNPAIATALALSEHTVKRHVTNILLKLGLPTRAAAAALAARSGLA